ncbi:acyltransferase family protein [Actinoplanes sp. NPDC020271]|uniref:acyltransferase family protein n=1 Tax=Actinoplanes sp. NPDC020271 TaxID=3363896 RepID=UPI003788B3CB
MARRAPRLAVLDGLRLVAALAVASYHLTVSWRIDGYSPPQHFLPTVSHFTIYGFLGVELFFLISGFVIGMSSWNRSLGDFFTSRVSRLYPAYWACVLITAAVVTYFPISGGIPVKGIPELREIAVNLTMLQEPLGVNSVDSVYWTLFIELRFYILFAALAAFGLTYTRVVAFCMVWMTAAVFAPALGNQTLSVIIVPDYAPYFIAGIAAFLIHRFGRSPLLFAIIGFAWLLSVKRSFDRVADLNPGFDVAVRPGVAVVTAMFAAILVVALGWTDRIRWRWLTTAGALTYPFYLLHQRIGYTVIRRAYDGTALPVWFLEIGTIVLLLGLAWLVYRLVEKPMARWIRTTLRTAFSDMRAKSAADAAAAAGTRLSHVVPRQRG